MLIKTYDPQFLAKKDVKNYYPEFKFILIFQKKLVNLKFNIENSIRVDIFEVCRTFVLIRRTNGLKAILNDYLKLKSWFKTIHFCRVY